VTRAAATARRGATASFATRRLASRLRTGDGRLLTKGEVGSDRGHVLIKLSDSGGAAIGDAVQGRLPDVASQAESGGGQLHRRFCHISTIPDNK
jgi:hypothetical protein